MAWEEIESAAGNLVIIGDKERHHRKVSGLLVGLKKDPKFEDKKRYVIMLPSGELIEVASSGSIDSKVGPAHIGMFVKFEFVGWEQGAGGQFKNITVKVNNELSPEIEKRFPPLAKAFKTLQARKAERGAERATVTEGKEKKETKDLDALDNEPPKQEASPAGYDEFPESLDEEDDDLPF